MKVLTIGEIMLRLKSPGMERPFQSPYLEATFGGGESNVGVSLSNYGIQAQFLTALPENALGEQCIKELPKLGVDVSKILRSKGVGPAVAVRQEHPVAGTEIVEQVLSGFDRCCGKGHSAVDGKILCQFCSI